MEAKIKREELKEKLAEINQKIEEIGEKGETINGTENIETFLADYRHKLDQLEFLISNLTISDPPASSKSSSDSNENIAETNKNSWRSLLDMRLKNARNVIFKLTSLTSSRKHATTTTTTTVTKYLPTSKRVLIIQFFYFF